jgi:transcription elongation factor Elf1
MNITRETISFTCPSCGHTTKPHVAIKNLVEGRKLVCEKCGREIPVDKEAFANVERILQRLGVPGAPDMPTGVTTVTRSTVALRCPHCNTLSTVSQSLTQLGERDKIFCQNCGKEIPIDRDKIHRAQSVVDRLGDGPGTGALDTPEGPVVVKTRTFSFNVNKNIEIGEIGKPSLPDADGPILISPGSSGRSVIEPKRGCLGVMAVFILLSITALIYGFLG